MHVEVTRVPPNQKVSVALGCKFKGRYDVTAENFVEEFDAEEELRAWLQYCNMIPLLIERVIADLKVHGICILRFKGIVIRDTEWTKPESAVDWLTCKFPDYLKLKSE
ncbi:hypothetical protein QDY63_14880 [Pseudomonas brenneri]|uniref:hypothetical protein n=1 Tax=Pseudomonas brenneri TaxID=129817 RepID=UPI0025A2B1A5|nr:hypothetical protein [Pseudomonas brenneri]WJM88685.1 hypothetical protein QDY63_14880 [Pseudomonas brenneri]